MKPYKTVIYSFLLGGLLALIAQAMLVCTRTAFTGTPLEFWIGGSVLLLMGVVGCFLGGFGNYQYFEEWATFGALLPFSGFAMAVGMKMHGPYSTGATMGKSVWAGLWLVIWFNVVGAVVCILFGFIMTMAGWQTPHFDANSTPLVFPGAFLMGGILTAVFQIVWLIVKSITPKAKPVWILMFAWMMGAICAPCGLSGFLASTFGEGFSVMIPVGGYNMYNVGMDLALGETAVALTHLGGFLLAVAGLFFTGLFTFLIFKGKFGRRTVAEAHLLKAQRAVEELAPKIEAAKKAQEAAAQAE